ncbi:MAG: hypothetical protein LUI02_07535 [Clostridiales bacterium]|nr:hypothetical protein [Clostridiales bacterium]
MGRRNHLNVGVVIFLIIIIYVLFNVFSYFTKSTAAEYEVGQGTIATNHVYSALAVRDETIVYAGQSGYVNYYIKNGAKAAVNDIVYSIDTAGTISDQITAAASNEAQLSDELISEVSDDVDTFTENYDGTSFSSVYTFRDDLGAQLTQTLSVNALNALSDVVTTAAENNTFFLRTAGEAGIVVYYTDGYENVTVDNFSSDVMDSSGYSRNSLYAGEYVSSGSPVYKRINSETWNLIMAVPDDVAKGLSDSSTVKIRFCKDNYTVSAPFSIIKSGGNYYLNLTLTTAMIRYANDRFLDVELVVSEQTGLKIPNTAITSKEFFTVPKEYFTLGGDSSDPGLLIRSEEDEDVVTLVTPTIYYETDDYYYIDSEDVSAGDVVLMSDSSRTYTIGSDTDSLIGVYNINKGYAVFKQINIISQNETYAIVETKTSYGIALYDHIALDASKISENELVTR